MTGLPPKSGTGTPLIKARQLALDLDRQPEF
ncbi:hypothetical protein MNBD_ALPHA09-11, partial [hydrothermal vent metagenome]